MPGRLPRPCAHPGCPNLVTEGPRCEEHRKQYQKDQGVGREKTAARGYGERHRKWRRIVLARHPLCVECAKEGRTTPATIADHAIGLQDWGTRPGSPWNLDNGQGLCVTHHNRKIVRETRARREGRTA